MEQENKKPNEQNSQDDSEALYIISMAHYYYRAAVCYLDISRSYRLNGFRRI